MGVCELAVRRPSPADGDLELQEHYGSVVWTHKEMDEARRSECLCRLCDRLVVGDEANNCKVASAFYAICQAGDAAMSRNGRR